MERLAEDNNVDATHLLGKLLQREVQHLIRNANDKSPAQLQRLPEIEQLRDILKPLIQGSDVAKVKIYSLSGLTVFSTEVKQIGEDKSRNEGFIAASQGRVASTLEHRNQFSAFEGVRNEVDMVASYVPIIEGGRVVAVFEQYHDVTNLIEHIDRSLWQAAPNVAIVLCSLYLMLLLVVRHAQKLLSAQEAQLETANRELDQRVEERTRALQLSQMELSIAATAFESQQSTIVTDAKGVILRANAAFLSATGLSAQEVHGQSTRVLQSGRHDQAFYQEMWDTLRRNGFWQGELWSKSATGEEVPKWLTISAVKDAADAVTHYIGTYVDISERKQAQEKIRRLAFFDQLTDLPNRTLLRGRLQQAMTANAHSGDYGAVLLIDLDNFKSLNDARGHASGDQLLIQVARRLHSLAAPADTVARLGGDEYVVILSCVEGGMVPEVASALERHCNRILQVLRQPYTLLGSDFHCSGSVGATLFKGEETPLADVLRQANLAVHQAKQGGGNRFAFFDPQMESAAVAHAQLSEDLRVAIQGGQLELYYQPQVNGENGLIEGAEALVRWNHPTRGMVSPVEFIPHAERTGLILPLGAWVLENACEHLALWATDPAMAALSVAVNVSAQQFMAADFAEQVLATLERTGANPLRLKLELTESLFAGDFEQIVALMHKLKAIGIGFSLDDFGTGYSSLAYLSRLPLDQLKIDRSFVTHIESDENNVVICAAIINLAHSLRLKVVAEGVETVAQRYFLSTVHRCNLLQGYLYSRPVARQAFERMVASWPG
ncbi:MAG: EAL domain-containing protein [Burkholderiales bacterium]|nr:EAL domain-containing protein [Burkholderiales bacterium]